jgi:hypothetical protein
MLREKLPQIYTSSLTPQRILIVLGVFGIILLLSISGIYYAVKVKPEIGAQAAQVLRAIMGDRAVADLETLVFEVQDNARKFQYQMLGQKAESPWALTPMPTPIVELTPTLPAVTPNPLSTPTATVKPNITVTGTSWPPPNVMNRRGQLEDEGIWVPYIYDPTGRVAAYRTFLQPDKERPYVITAIVVFNFNITRIGYVTGTLETASTAKVYRSGAIPDNDRQPGILLAAFNGGFQTRHGNYGAMYDSVVLVPPRPDIATLALYQDGSVAIMPWDAKLNDTKEVKSWRQNAAILVHNSEINPDSTNKNKLLDNWGGNVNDVVGAEVVTWRSGVGLNTNKKLLYYVAGPSLTVHTLATVFKAVGAKDAMQLDINPYWVQFVSINNVNNQLKTNPLLPEMTGYLDRYIGSYTGDYFYMVSHNTEQ